MKEVKHDGVCKKEARVDKVEKGMAISISSNNSTDSVGTSTDNSVGSTELTQMPMRVVAFGADENQRVKIWRPWGPNELNSLLFQNSFPNPKVSPTLFMDKLETMTRVYDIVPCDLTQIMECALGTVAFRDLKDELAIPDGTTWEGGQTVATCLKIIRNALKAYTRRFANIHNITSACQKQQEEVLDWAARFKSLWQTDSGMEENEGEPFQVQNFVNGLKPAIKKHLKTVVLGWESQTMSAIVNIAIKVERQVNSTDLKNKGQEVRLFYQGSNAGQPRGRKKNRRKPAVCWICGVKGHYARDCRGEKPPQ